MTTLPFWNSPFSVFALFDLFSFFEPNQQFIRSDFMHDAHGLFYWECIGAKPFSFQNVHLLWPLLGFLTNPYVQILPYFMPSPPTSSVVPASHTQCFQISSFQVSCFTYRSFMDLLNEARLILIMGDLKSGAVYLCMCLCLSKFIPKKI